MRASQKIIILKDIVIVLSVLCVFTGIVCYKIGSITGYQHCMEQVID